MKNSRNQTNNKNHFNFTLNVLIGLALAALVTFNAHAQQTKNDNMAVILTFNQINPPSVKINAVDYKKIENAESLEISGTYLKSLPGYIFKMDNIENLTVKSNGINELSSNIKNLYNLRILDLSQTSVQSIPEEIRMLKLLKEIHLPYSIWAFRLDEVKSLTNAQVILE